MWISGVSWWSACWPDKKSCYLWDDTNEAWLASGLFYLFLWYWPTCSTNLLWHKFVLWQESGRHAETLDAITRYLDMGIYSEWDEEKKLEFLTRELKGKRPLVPASIEVKYLDSLIWVLLWRSNFVNPLWDENLHYPTY